MTDAFLLPRTRPSPSVQECVCVCVCVCVAEFVCPSMWVCANVCVCFPSSTLTSLNSWLSLSSHSRGRLFSQLLAAIQRGSITAAAINTRGHGMHSITDIIEMDSIRLDPLKKKKNRGGTFTLSSTLECEAASSVLIRVSHFNMRSRQSRKTASHIKSKSRETDGK